MTQRVTIGVATACAAVLGAVPAPTSAAITALQQWLVLAVAESAGAREVPRRVRTAPLLARTVGSSLWQGLYRALGRSTPLGMLAGAGIAAAATWTLGTMAAASARQATAAPAGPSADTAG